MANVCNAKSRASEVTCQKSACRPCTARSQVYCSCLSRQSAVSLSMLSPSTSRQPLAAAAKSNRVPYASNTQACTPAKGTLLMRGTSGWADLAMIGHNVRERRFLIRGVEEHCRDEKLFSPPRHVMRRKRLSVVDNDTPG